MMNKQFSTAILTLSIISTLVLWGCDKNKEVVKEKVLRPVKTVTVEHPFANRSHEFTAVVDASRKADLSFKISGEVAEFNVNQGETVVKGQVIAKLDDRDFKIKFDDAKSSFAKAIADYQRGKKLIGASTISQADFDQLKAKYNSAKANLASASNNLEYTELKASFNGIIAKKYTEKFQQVNAQAAIVALHDLSQINLKIELPESIMINVKRQDKPPKLTAKFDAIKDVVFPLTFKEVATQADDVTKAYEVTLTMQAPTDHTILPGMTASVTAEELLTTESKNNQFYLPVKTVLKDSKGHYVYLVVKEENGVGKIQRQSVVIGEITPLGLEIFSGVKQGDEVISAGMSKVSNGLTVKIQKG